MRNLVWGIAVVALLASGASVWAHEEHEHQHAAGASKDQTLTGEVVDVICYLGHNKEGLGKGHAECAKKCIKSGLPVAIKVGDQLYLATMEAHDPANASLADLAGQQVTVRGHVLERDGQHLISITSVEKTQ